MDVFNTAATCCEIIWRILEASAAFSKESQSLAIRFKYDARILRHFCDYFEHAQGTGLNPQDAALLHESILYLGPLLKRVELCKTKLEAQGRWAREFTRLTWVLRRNEMRDLEKELHEWVRRLDLKLVALPERARSVMFLGDVQEKMTPNVAVKARIERFAAKAATAKKAIWEPLLVAPLQIQYTSHQTPNFSLGLFDGLATIMEFRLYLGPTESYVLDDTKAELGELVAALNYLDSSVTGLLRCLGFFYDPLPSPRFGLIYQLPMGSPHEDFIPFKSLLSARDSKGRRTKLRYSLNQRLEFARKLATAVFFVHSLGWVHKAIRPQIILLFRKRREQQPGESASVHWSLESPALVGFEIARSSEGDTDPGRRCITGLDVSAYTHPNLQQPVSHVRHTMGHDVYSVGVVLLELGIWSSIDSRPELRADMNPEEVGQTLRVLARETELLMGRRYRHTVEWCLSQGQGGDAGSVKLISEVLEKLEDLAESV
ncbi:serine/threonine protein kinase [Aspergillus terreus]|uniref:Serine/threonine protein kinase n=1 Tax=Aspergillus terreus TaxID=33178 RepID=A0A5M3YL29_ASPTE|nr:hypothetical protein ATETN484_0001019100 [Aspergillus terreus]GFF14001.1 serine/threonine protein kinase [Aspergillus terreus]